jgi:hypothetical protein
MEGQQPPQSSFDPFAYNQQQQQQQQQQQGYSIPPQPQQTMQQQYSVPSEYRQQATPLPQQNFVQYRGNINPYNNSKAYVYMPPGKN